jgi:hypothetical protein
VRVSSHVLYLLSIVESTEPNQVYDVKLDFVSERTIIEKSIIIRSKLVRKYPGGGYMSLELFVVSARTNKRHHHHCG